jgi:hypothetical protein
VVEGTGLENRHTGNGIVSSNLTPSVASMRWRRLDVPGHDTCRLERDGAGWRLHGVAVFRHGTGGASLAYSVRCDAGWRTVAGEVRGMLGERPVNYAVVREGQGWTVNGIAVPALDHLVDLDLSFTPATNLQQLRRVSMKLHEVVELPVAWLDVDAGVLTELRQRYERQGDRVVRYEAPSLGYAGLLDLAPNGFIRRYPNLWEAEPEP